MKSQKKPQRQGVKYESYEKIIRRLDGRPLLAIIFMCVGAKLGDFSHAYVQLAAFLSVLVSIALALTVRGNLGMSSFTSQHFKEDEQKTKPEESASNFENPGGRYCPMCDSFDCRCSGC